MRQTGIKNSVVVNLPQSTPFLPAVCALFRRVKPAEAALTAKIDTLLNGCRVSHERRLVSVLSLADL